MFHAFLGEKLPDWQAAASLVKKIAENFKLPYYTMSPTYSVCSEHGYLVGEQHTCPHCGKEAEVYSRITGYYRPVKNWNDGKSQEFKDRKVYDIGRSKLRRAGRAGAEVTAEVQPSTATGDLMLFATRTCPNCKQAEELLREAGIGYRKVLAEENPDLAVRYAIRQAPTLVIDDGKDPVKVVGVGKIRQFAAENRAASVG